MTTDSNPAPAPGVPVLADRSFRHALPPGSRVLTAAGDCRVETLRPGDRIVTRDRGMVELRNIIRNDVPTGTAMVAIPAGAMGRNRPERDLHLPLDQPVVIRDWRAKTIYNAREARIAATRLVDGAIIRRVRTPAMTTYSLVLDAPSALYVDGIEIVSGARDAIPAR
ncbi:Hint domain-containing protein [Jannaschia sp. KMU-145]|uniref:Hint domain-containing protein n=1 Tax=Jannaschia halovivens TaxID=3388667 RepID=UPI00396B249D